MPVPLKEVLAKFGYAEEKEQIALVRLAVLRNFFPDRFKDKKISDVSAAEVRDILNIQYASLIEGIEDWSKKSDANWLRKNFKLSTAGNFIDIERWLAQPIKPENNKDAPQIFDALKTLKFTDSVEWPEEKVDFIFMHGGVEENVRERVLALPSNLPEGCEIIYGTNPRMLDNKLDQKSFAKIVALNYGYKGDKLNSAIKTIESVLEEHSDYKTSDKNWLVDPQGLKKIIADRLGEKSWHKEVGAYYENPDIYELSAKNSQKRRPSPAGLPTAVDMAGFWCMELTKLKIKIIPLYSVPPPIITPTGEKIFRIATTEDNIKDLWEKFGEKLRNSTIVFISDNYSHYIAYQHEVVKQTIQELEEKYGKMNIKVITVGRGTDKVNLLMALDALAKIFYCRKARILKALTKSQEEKLHNSTLDSLDVNKSVTSAPQEKVYETNRLFSHGKSIKTDNSDDDLSVRKELSFTKT
ncbi:MAG: hypothetical protein JO131_04480 [Gammaproteobacteria bacterium]|nr:hypothetical protein [Gammaproteobacteria bacterium]